MPVGYSLSSIQEIHAWKVSKHRMCGEGVSRTSVLHSNGRSQGVVSLFD